MHQQSLASASNPFEVDRLNGPADFQPEWDIPSLNATASDVLVEQIRRLSGASTVDPGRKIPALLAQAGWGKTHLFARIAHQLERDVLIVFVPQFRDVQDPLSHIRWHVVENLFARLGDEPSKLDELLAKLCLPSFRDYFSFQREGVLSRCRSVNGRMETGNIQAVLEIVSAVHELQPFVRLANSVAQSFPHLDGNVVRALLLGWAPIEYASIAQRWLRGDVPPEEDLRLVGLPDDVEPDTVKLLQAIVVLLGHQTPVVVFCDQMEAVVDDTEGVGKVSNCLIDILQSVPTAMIAISCLRDQWSKFTEASFGAFQQRVQPIQLDELSPHNAFELVQRRLRSWPRYEPERGAVWPFQEDSISTLVLQDQINQPRALVRRCRDALDDWDGNGTISFAYGGENTQVGLDELFLRQWNAEREKITVRTDFSAEDQPEDWLYTAVKEAVTLAAGHERVLQDVSLSILKENIVAVGSQKRRSFQVEITFETVRVSVIVAVTKIDNARQFVAYFDALQKAINEHDSNCLLVHPRGEPRMGAKTAGSFAKLKDQGKLRSFGFADDAATFHHLACLTKLLDLAKSEELELGGTKISVDDCRDFVVKTGVLQDLELFKALAIGWASEEDRVSSAQPAVGSVTGVSTDASESFADASGAQDERIFAAEREQPSPSTAVEASPRSEAETWTAAQLHEVTEKLRLWSLPVEAAGYNIGPTFARLKVRPKGNTTVGRIRNKNEDLKIHLELEQRPIIGSQAGHISIDVELPSRTTVALRDALANNRPDNEDDEPVFPLGVDVTGKAYWLNLADPSYCHLLIGGTTGSGKSEFLKALVGGLAAQLGPDQVQFVLIDPKKVTFNFAGEDSPYFLRPIVNDVEAALPLVRECFAEVERRFDLLQQLQADNIADLEGKDALPQIVMIIDEFADLMVEKESKQALEKPLKRIGGKARAAGIHLVLATQRPDKDVVTPLLRTNLPGRISLKVATAADSKIILDEPGAESLLGRGDLFWKRGGTLRRLQSPYVSRNELLELLRTT